MHSVPMSCHQFKFPITQVESRKAGPVQACTSPFMQNTVRIRSRSMKMKSQATATAKKGSPAQTDACKLCRLLLQNVFHQLQEMSSSNEQMHAKQSMCARKQSRKPKLDVGNTTQLRRRCAPPSTLLTLAADLHQTCQIRSADSTELGPAETSP